METSTLSPSNDGARADRNRVAVVATAAKEGGAWRIVMEIANNAIRDPNSIYTFITIAPLGLDGVENIVLGSMNFFQRFYFEFFGIRKILCRNGKPPNALISLNNIAILGAPGIPQFVYVHQGLALYPEFRWRLNKSERGLFFYQKIYGLLMQLSIIFTSSQIIVQTPTMAKRVMEQWGRSSLCWFPNLDVPIVTWNTKALPNPRVYLFPANFYPYKNHSVLAAAIRIIRSDRPDIYDRIRIYFTIDNANRNPDIEDPHIVSVGNLPYDSLMRMVAEAAALVFPSQVETVGLPLVEASRFGLPILCTDADYSREILAGYDGAKFLDPKIPETWAMALCEIDDQIEATGRILRYSKHRIQLRETNLNDLALFI